MSNLAYKRLFKMISCLLSILMVWQGVVWANPDVLRSTRSSDTLGVPSFFKLPEQDKVVVSYFLRELKKREGSPANRNLSDMRNRVIEALTELRGAHPDIARRLPDPEAIADQNVVDTGELVTDIGSCRIRFVTPKYGSADLPVGYGRCIEDEGVGAKVVDPKIGEYLLRQVLVKKDLPQSKSAEVWTEEENSPLTSDDLVSGFIVEGDPKRLALKFMEKNPSLGRVDSALDQRIIRALGELKDRIETSGLDAQTQDDLIGMIEEAEGREESVRDIFYLFNAVVIKDKIEEPDKTVREDKEVPGGWILGFNTVRDNGVRFGEPFKTVMDSIRVQYAANIIGLSAEVLEKIGSDELIFQEYILHEVICPFLYHPSARKVQERLFPENYDKDIYGDKREGHRDGELSLILKQVIWEECLGPGAEKISLKKLDDELKGMEKNLLKDFDKLGFTGNGSQEASRILKAFREFYARAQLVCMKKQSRLYDPSGEAKSRRHIRRQVRERMERLDERFKRVLARVEWIWRMEAVWKEAERLVEEAQGDMDDLLAGIPVERGTPLFNALKDIRKVIDALDVENKRFLSSDEIFGYRGDKKYVPSWFNNETRPWSAFVSPNPYKHIKKLIDVVRGDKRKRIRPRQLFSDDTDDMEAVAPKRRFGIFGNFHEINFTEIYLILAQAVIFFTGFAILHTTFPAVIPWLMYFGKFLPVIVFGYQTLRNPEWTLFLVPIGALAICAVFLPGPFAFAGVALSLAVVLIRSLTFLREKKVISLLVGLISRPWKEGTKRFNELIEEAKENLRQGQSQEPVKDPDVPNVDITKDITDLMFELIEEAQGITKESRMGWTTEQLLYGVFCLGREKEKDVTDDYLRGQLAFRRGDYRKAEESFALAVRADELNPDYLLAYGITAHFMSRWDGSKLKTAQMSYKLAFNALRQKQAALVTDADKIKLRLAERLYKKAGKSILLNGRGWKDRRISQNILESAMKIFEVKLGMGAGVVREEDASTENILKLLLDILGTPSDPEEYASFKKMNEYEEAEVLKQYTRGVRQFDSGDYEAADKSFETAAGISQNQDHLLATSLVDHYLNQWDQAIECYQVFFLLENDKRNRIPDYVPTEYNKLKTALVTLLLEYAKKGITLEGDIDYGSQPAALEGIRRIFFRETDFGEYAYAKAPKAESLLALDIPFAVLSLLTLLGKINLWWYFGGFLAVQLVYVVVHFGNIRRAPPEAPILRKLDYTFRVPIKIAFVHMVVSTFFPIAVYVLFPMVANNMVFPLEVLLKVVITLYALRINHRLAVKYHLTANAVALFRGTHAPGDIDKSLDSRLWNAAEMERAVRQTWKKTRKTISPNRLRRMDMTDLFGIVGGEFATIKGFTEDMPGYICPYGQLSEKRARALLRKDPRVIEEHFLFARLLGDREFDDYLVPYVVATSQLIASLGRENTRTTERVRMFRRILDAAKGPEARALAIARFKGQDMTTRLSTLPGSGDLFLDEDVYVGMIAGMFDKKRLSRADVKRIEKFLDTFASVANLIQVKGDKSLEKVIRIAHRLYLNPSTPARELCGELGYEEDDLDKGREELKTIFSKIRKNRLLQKVLSKGSRHSKFIDTMMFHLNDKERLLAMVEHGEAVPREVDLQLSARCGYRCVFCYNQAKGYEDRPGEVLTKDEAFKLLKGLKDIGVKMVNFSGGKEPALRPSTPKEMEEAHRLGLEFQYFTSMPLGPAVRKAAMNARRVKISMDAATPETRLKVKQPVKGSGDFDQVVESIKKLVALKKHTGSSVRIGISFVTVKQNYKEMLKFLDLAKDLELDFVNISFDYLGRNSFTDREKEEIKSIIQTARRKYIEDEYGSLRITFGEGITVLEKEDSYSEELIGADVCRANKDKIAIDPKGNMYVCCHGVEPGFSKPLYVLGNVEQEDLGDLINEDNKRKIKVSMCNGCHDFERLTNIIAAKLEDDIAFGISIEEQPFMALDEFFGKETDAGQGPEKTDKDSDKPQIGKKYEVKEVHLTDTGMKVTVLDNETGQTEELNLTATIHGPPTDEEKQAIVEAVRDSENQNEHKTFLEEMLKASPANIPLYSYRETDKPIKDLFGFAHFVRGTFFSPPNDSHGFPWHSKKRGPKGRQAAPGLIALHEFLADNPVALFHEIGEYLVKSKELQLKEENGELVVSIGGSETRVKLSADTLRFIESEHWADGWRQNQHYLLRVLQRELFGMADERLTRLILAGQSDLGHLLGPGESVYMPDKYIGKVRDINEYSKMYIWLCKVFDIAPGDEQLKGNIATAAHWITKGSDAFSAAKALEIFEDEFYGGRSVASLDRSQKKKLIIATYQVSMTKGDESLSEAVEHYKKALNVQDFSGLSKKLKEKLIIATYSVGKRKADVSLGKVIEHYKKAFGGIQDFSGLSEELQLQLIIATYEVGMYEADESLSKAIEHYKTIFGLRNFSSLSDDDLKKQLIMATYNIGIIKADALLPGIINRLQIVELSDIELVSLSWHVVRLSAQDTTAVAVDDVFSQLSAGEDVAEVIKYINRIIWRLQQTDPAQIGNMEMYRDPYSNEKRELTPEVRTQALEDILNKLEETDLIDKLAQAMMDFAASDRKKKQVLALDLELGEEDVRKLFKKLATVLPNNNGELSLFLDNLEIIGGEGRHLAERIKSISTLSGKGKDKVDPKDIVIVTNSSNMAYYSESRDGKDTIADLDGRATIAGIDNTEFSGESYFPLMETTLFAIGKHLGWEREDLLKYYDLIPNAFSMDELGEAYSNILLSKDIRTFVIKLIPDAVPFEDGQRREIIDRICTMLAQA